MKHIWQLQEAKNRFSEMVERALKKGPQTVTRRGVETVVVVSVEEYRRLAAPPTSLSEFFQDSPLHGVALDLERSDDLPREIDL
jgi:prevent-host-death family protein